MASVMNENWVALVNAVVRTQCFERRDYACMRGSLISDEGNTVSGTRKSLKSQLTTSFASGTAPGKSLNCFNAYFPIPITRANRREPGLGFTSDLVQERRPMFNTDINRGPVVIERLIYSTISPGPLGS